VETKKYGQPNNKNGGMKSLWGISIHLLFGVDLAVRKGVPRKSYRKHIWLSGFLIRMKNFSRSDIDGKHKNA
jgi:hypothetical protein